jgi:hypothetical protein
VIAGVPMSIDYSTSTVPPFSQEVILIVSTADQSWSEEQEHGHLLLIGL